MTRKQNKAKQHKKTGHGWKDCCNFKREILWELQTHQCILAKSLILNYAYAEKNLEGLLPKQVEIGEENKPWKTELHWMRFVFAAILTEYISQTMHTWWQAAEE